MLFPFARLDATRKPTFAAVTRVERSPAIASGAFLFVAAVTAATDRGKVSAG